MFGQVHLIAALLHVLAVQLLDVVAVKNGLARLDGFQERLDLSQQLFFQHTGVDGRLIGVIFEDVPAGENQIFNVCQGNKILNLRKPSFGPFAQADGTHLGKRANGQANAFAHRFDARHESGGHSAHAGNHYPQLAAWGSNLASLLVRRRKSHESGPSLSMSANLLSSRIAPDFANREKAKRPQSEDMAGHLYPEDNGSPLR